MKKFIFNLIICLQISIFSQNIFNAPNVDINPTLKWYQSKGATSYTLQVSTDISFNNLVFSKSGINDTVQRIFGLNYDTKYYWRVSASNQYGTSNWSTISSFTTIKSDYTKGKEFVIADEREKTRVA